MKYLTSLFSIILLFGATSCQKKMYTPATYPKPYVVFGNMGGFAGTTTEYTLLQNGQLFKRYGKILPQEYSVLPNARTKGLRSLFKHIKALDLPATALNTPGNMSYFVRLIDADKKIDHQVLWGDTGEGVPEGIRNLYTTLHTLARDAEKSEEKEK